MKQEDKVPLREQCQKLVELGVILKTEKQWISLGGYWKIVSSSKNNELAILRGFIIPAPDVAELGALLPGNIRRYELKCVKEDGEWHIEYYEDDECNPGHLILDFYFKSEAQARCEALIWLLENKHLKMEDL